MEALDARFFSRASLPDELHPGHEQRIYRYFELLSSGESHFDPSDTADIELSALQRPEME